MLNNWIFKAWKHNRTQTKLIPILKVKQKHYWLLLLLLTIPIAGAAYSIYGFTQDIFPNLSLIKNDVKFVCYSERASIIKKKSIRYSCDVS